MSGRPLRVLYVVPDLGVGGAERHAVTLLCGLDRSRFEPRLVCIGDEGELFDGLVAGGVPAKALGRSKRQSLGALAALVREMRRCSPDLVIVRGYNAEVLGRLAAVLAGVPRRVVWVHNCDDLAPRGVIRHLADRALDLVTDAYFGVAQRQVRYMTEELGHPAHKIRIVHNGVDPALFDDQDTARDARAELGLGESDLVVGILAALRPEKDHEMFLAAAQLVAAQVPQARFLVVGDGSRRELLKDQADRLGLTGRVVFTGARDDVPVLLRAMDVFVLCSFTIECFPMALLEAMAAGLPAVCTSVGGVPELLEDGETGWLVPPKDAPALADRLVALLRSPATRQRFGAAARARVETQFSLRRSLDRAQQELEAVAGVAERPASAASPVRLAVVMDETFVGGVEQLTLNLFQAFHPDVVRPRLVCLRQAGPLGEDFRAAGFDVEVLDRTGRFDLRTLPRLVRSLRRHGDDAVLVAHHHRASLALARLARRLAGVPVDLVAAHDMDLRAVGKRCLPAWVVASLRLSSALVLLTPRQGDYLHREELVGRYWWSRTREVVIPNGIVVPPVPTDADRAKARAELGLDEGAFVVGIVARLSAQKAHHVLFRAFATVARSLPDARLVVVGGGDRESELRALATELGIGERTLFTGVRRDVPALLPAFDVACLSSVHEGVPVSVIEAMAAGVPVVATDCGSLRDMVADGRTGFTVPVGDSEALADRLLRLGTDDALRKRLGRSAREAVETTYSIDQTARGYESLLVDLRGSR